MVVSDISRLSNVNTYVSDDGMKMAWVDHVLATRSLDAIIGDINILDNVVVSDHKPVPFCLNCTCNKKLSHRRGTARCVVSVEILPIATQQCRNYLYDKS